MRWLSRGASRTRASWKVDDREGNVTLYETELAVLRKELNVVR